MFPLSRPFASLFFSKGGCLSRLLKILHFYISKSLLWLGFLPHKINTHKHTLKREKKTRERRRPTIADSVFTIYPLVVRRHPHHQSPISKTFFLNLFSRRRRGKDKNLTGGKTKKKTKKEEGRRFSASCLLRRVRNKSCEKRSTL